jgi:hypothetical protein
MKIYIIPIEEKFRPKKQGFKYPIHNKDYGVEQDFYKYLTNNKEILTNNPNKADWHYLSVFWTRWHLNHNYGKEGLSDLQNEVNKKITDSSKTFTICQYDDGPLADLEKATLFLASRKSESGIDIPLLSSPHCMPIFKKTKKYLASFVGRISTHELRIKMSEVLSKEKDILIKDGDFGPRYFINKILRSYISLCPRGYGGSSFRFFESMQLGVVPLLIGEPDTRPFKKFINWDIISLYSKNTDNLKNIILPRRQEELVKMGKEAKEVYENNLTYQKWCPYVIKELEQISNEK